MWGYGFGGCGGAAALVESVDGVALVRAAVVGGVSRAVWLRECGSAVVGGESSDGVKQF